MKAMMTKIESGIAIIHNYAKMHANGSFHVRSTSVRFVLNVARLQFIILTKVPIFKLFSRNDLDKINVKKIVFFTPTLHIKTIKAFSIWSRRDLASRCQ